MKRTNKNPVVILLVVSLAFLVFAGPAELSAASSPSLGNSSTYAIISSTWTNSTNAGLETAVTGNVCYTTPPGTPPISINGVTVTPLSQAVVPCDSERGTDQSSALSNINGQTGCTDLGVNVLLSGTYTPGCYSSSGTMDIALSTIVTLSGTGTFIFKSGGAFTSGDNSKVVLAGGASACDVFWAPVGHMVIGANSSTSATPTFVGNILQNSLSSFNVTLGHFVNLSGRVLAFGRTVTTDSNTIIAPSCAGAPATGGGGAARLYLPTVVPLISVTKVPSPLTLPGGPGPVTYTYTATNIGIVPMSDVWVKDNKCSSVDFISGDSNNNSLLDVDEAWVYRCTKTVSLTETNTATAHGKGANADSSAEIWDTTNATVVVGTSLTPPLIHLIKKPSAFFLSAPGGPVTYSYTVTNPGVAPLSDVSVIDDKCTGLPGRVIGHPGDINKNNLLESDEAWSFTCQSYLDETTTNIGTAEGHANGLTALDFAPATVVVAQPKFPSTGTSSNSTLLKILIPLGILALLFFAYREKKGRAT